MLKYLKNYRKIYTILGIIIVILSVYFFWPKTFKVNSEDHLIIQIDKEINHVGCSYELNEQEINNFVKILEKSKFRHGVSKPERMFSDRSTHIIVNGGGGSPIITTYYDTDKTYVFANISEGIFLNMYHRISNKDEIRKFVENIVNTKISEFGKIPSGAGGKVK